MSEDNYHGVPDYNGLVQEQIGKACQSLEIMAHNPLNIKLLGSGREFKGKVSVGSRALKLFALIGESPEKESPLLDFLDIEEMQAVDILEKKGVVEPAEKFAPNQIKGKYKFTEEGNRFYDRVGSFFKLNLDMY